MKKKSLQDKLKNSYLKLDTSRINFYKRQVANILQESEKEQVFTPPSNPSQGGSTPSTPEVNPSENDYVVDGYIDNYFV